MRWWILSIFFICPLFAAISPIARPLQQTSSDWLTLLHLSDCELPCWIGIKPGETTVGDAEMRVAVTYSDGSLYELEKPNNFWPSVIYKPTGAQLNIAFYSDNGPMTEASIVRGIILDSSWKMGTLDSRPTISDIQSVIGSPTVARLATGADNFSVALFYGDGRSNVFVNDLECDQVLPDQQIMSISLNDKIPPDIGWLSDPQSWQGFNYCYNFVRKLS